MEELDGIIETALPFHRRTECFRQRPVRLHRRIQPELYCRKSLAWLSIPEEKLNEAVPARPPVMCAGCPHRGLFYTLKKEQADGAGRYRLLYAGAAALAAIDTTICMGASVSGLHGFNKASGEKNAANTVAVIGDSTFMHSGVTGLINIAYNESTSTVIILDNSITGMTGHQQESDDGLQSQGDPLHKDRFGGLPCRRHPAGR